jgi:hypothetical protein
MLMGRSCWLMGGCLSIFNKGFITPIEICDGMANSMILLV